MKRLLPRFASVFMLMLSPASAWAMNGQLDMVEYLSDYYPKLSCSQLEKKFQFVKGNPNAFFVSNAPYFWDIMERDVKRHSSKKMVPSSLLQLFDKYQGLCVGNASLRDFGVALDSAGQVNFTLQAVDDVGICPLPLDLVRYLVMARVLNHSVDLSRLIMAYAAALKAEIAYKDSRVNSLLSSSQKIQHVATGATPIPSKAPSIPSCASRRPSAIEQEVAGLLNRYEGTPVCIEDFHTKDALESTSTRTLYEAKYYLNRAPVGPSKNVQLRSVEKSAVSYYMGKKSEIAPKELFPLACALAFRKTREKICPVLDLGSGPYYLVESRFLALTPIKNAPNQVELTQTLLSDEINWLAKFHRVALGRGEAALRTLLVLPKPPVSRQASDYAHEIEKSSAVLQATVDNISQKVERASSRLDKRLKNFARDCENFRNSKP